jgi:hypothetical protein
MIRNLFKKWILQGLMCFLAALVASFIFLKGIKVASAAEGGSGLYPLGYQGGSLAGVMPPPGFYFRNDFYFYDGSAGRSVLQGRVNLGLDEFLFGEFLTFSYISKIKVLGADYGAALLIPVLFADLNASLQGAGGAPGPRVSQNEFGLSDMALVPLILGWHHKDFHFIGQLIVYFPTGPYSLDRVVNVSKNHFGFDPNFTFTWFDMKSGNEVSLDLGLTLNLENGATNYRTGDEFHAEFQYNHHFLKQGLAVGAGGYAYQQVTGDSGSGAVLGPFRGRVLALGPQLSYMTKFKNRSFTAGGRYYREFLAQNRFEGNTFWVTITYQLF